MVTEKEMQDDLVIAMREVYGGDVSIRSFKDARIVTTLSHPYGVVIKMGDGSEFQLTIAQTGA